MKMHQDAGGTAQPGGMVMNPEIWRYVFDAIEDPLFLHDAQFRVLLANRAYCRAAGMTKTEVLGKPYWEVFPRGAGPLPGCKNAAIVKDNIYSRDEVNAGEQLFLSTGYTVRDDQGNVLYALHVLSDITVQRQSEDALRKSKDLLQAVVENMPARVFWKDRDSRFLGCNKQFAQDAGFSSPDELTGKTDFEMGWKDQAELYRADDKAVMESGNPRLDIEEPQTTPDGNTIWLRTSKVPLRDESKQVIGILGIYQDITGRKISENKLRLSAQLLDSSADSIMAFDLDGNFIYLNEAAWKTRGYTRDELMAMNLHALDVPAYEKFIEARIGELMVKSSNIFEAAHRCKDGSIMPIEVSSRIIESDGRKVIISAARDITERKAAEKALLASESRLNVILESTGDGILAVDIQGKVLKANRRFADIWKIPQSLIAGGDDRALLGYVLEQLVEPDAFLKKVQSLYASVSTDLGLIHFKDGRCFERFSSPMMEGSVIVGRVWSFRDITERKQAEANLAEQIEELRRWHDTTMGREARILELKHEVNELLGQSGQPPRYPSAESPDQKEE